MNIVTLLTDFALQDHFVGVMKGVIAQAAVPITFVDLTHEVPPQDIHKASFVLDEAYEYFPPGTIHLVVVDPGVGTERRRLLVESEGHFFVGPDNGVLSNLIRKAGSRTWAANKETFLKKNQTTTFEGRDVFAPMVRNLVNGMRPEQFGKVITDPVLIDHPQPKKNESEVQGEIIYIDRFGNLISNVRREELATVVQEVRFRDQTFNSLNQTYGDADEGQLMALWNSMARLEIACRNGSAKNHLQAKIGDPITLILATS